MSGRIGCHRKEWGMNKLECLKGKYCKKQHYDKLDQILTPPFETDDKQLSRILSYFLHLAPNISSAHSNSLSNINNLHNAILTEMFEGRNFVADIDFCSPNCKIIKHTDKLVLSGNNICLKCKRAVCKRNPKKKAESAETDLNCLLRNLRNSIAHGRVYYHHAGNRVLLMFEDITQNSTNISARIVCTRADLEHWKSVLQKYK